MSAAERGSFAGIEDLELVAQSRLRAKMHELGQEAPLSPVEVAAMMRALAAFVDMVDSFFGDVGAFIDGGTRAVEERHRGR